MSVLEAKNAKSLEAILPILWYNANGQTYHAKTGKFELATPYIIGAPGAGKSACIDYMCKQKNWGLLPTHWGCMPLEETGGIPQFQNTMVEGVETLSTVWSLPNVFEKLYRLSTEYSGEGQGVIWLLDDMHQSSTGHLNLMYELLTYRSLRGWSLPKNVAIFMAGNHGRSKTGAQVMFSAIVNRVMMLPIVADYDSWRKNFARPEKIHPAVVSFLSQDSAKHLFMEEEQVDNPWCSPRAWTRFANTLTIHETNDRRVLEPDELLYIGTGLLGSEAISRFVTYYTIYSKFDIPKILQDCKDPKKYNLPEQQIDRYALAFASINWFAGNKERRKQSNELANLLYCYIKQQNDISLMMIHELMALEDQLPDCKNIYQDLAIHLNKLEPGITMKLLQNVVNVCS